MVDDSHGGKNPKFRWEGKKLGRTPKEEKSTKEQILDVVEWTGYFD